MGAGLGRGEMGGGGGGWGGKAGGRRGMTTFLSALFASLSPKDGGDDTLNPNCGSDLTEGKRRVRKRRTYGMWDRALCEEEGFSSFPSSFRRHFRPFIIGGGRVRSKKKLRFPRSFQSFRENPVFPQFHLFHLISSMPNLTTVPVRISDRGKL